MLADPNDESPANVDAAVSSVEIVNIFNFLMLLFMNHCNDFAPLLDNKNSYSYSYVMLLEIQLSRGEGLDPVNQFKTCIDSLPLKKTTYSQTCP
jgi:hypothetical protein